ncbi:hypothetical protein G6F65_021856 [Rhizopus arrhizus]|nr:hypothetical protein G6F65_021856 [Rhizopus arrhizus]
MSGFENFWAIYGNLVLTLGTNALLALSIWLTLACGMLARANAAFMGIGAYTAALLTMNYDAPFTVALAGGMAAPALVAALIGLPTLRLSGVYLAMATLGFADAVVACGAGGRHRSVRALARTRLQDRPLVRRDPRRRNGRGPDGH